MLDRESAAGKCTHLAMRQTCRYEKSRSPGAEDSVLPAGRAAHNARPPGRSAKLHEGSGPLGGSHQLPPAAQVSPCGMQRHSCHCSLANSVQVVESPKERDCYDPAPEGVSKATMPGRTSLCLVGCPAFSQPVNGLRLKNLTISRFGIPVLIDELCQGPHAADFQTHKMVQSIGSGGTETLPPDVLAPHLPPCPCSSLDTAAASCTAQQCHAI